MVEIESIEAQTIEDEISGEFCECLHQTSEHFVGDISKTSKCYGLIFNGTLWKACECTKLKILQFSIHILVSDHANNSQTSIAA